MARGSNGKAPAGAGAGSKWQVMSAGTEVTSTWDQTNPEMIGEAVLNVIRQGDAIMVSTTSDGGAIRVTIFEGDAKHHQYVASVEELEKLLRGISQTLD